MKKGLLSLVMAVTLSVGFSSCKKCVECKGKDPAAGNGEVKKEYCGSKDERTKGQAEFNSMGYTEVKCD